MGWMNFEISSNSTIMWHLKIQLEEGKEKIGWTWRNNSNFDSCLKSSNCLIGRNRWLVYDEIIHILVIKAFLQWHWIWNSLFSKLLNILMVYWSKLHKAPQYPTNWSLSTATALKKCWSGKVHKNLTFTLPSTGYCYKWQKYKYNLKS